METILVPLNKLTVSDLNVRKTGTKDIDDLKANIRENGLISRVLSVVATEREGHYAVIAGGRRLCALKELAKDKFYPNNPEVERVIKSAEEAATISLSENVIRAAMHPADQFETAGRQRQSRRRDCQRLRRQRGAREEAAETSEYCPFVPQGMPRLQGRP